MLIKIRCLLFIFTACVFISFYIIYHQVSNTDNTKSINSSRTLKSSTNNIERPLEFLSQEHIDAHDKKAFEKKTLKEIHKPIEFLDLEKHQNKNDLEAKSTKKLKEGNIIHFLHNIDEKKNSKQNQNNIVVNKKVKIKDEYHFHELETINPHPLMSSPRKGTDISPLHQMAVLLCPNQSKCIIPELQLQVKLKIYLCKHATRQGVRFYFLAREGFLLHPNVELQTEANINNADYIIYLPGSAPWEKTECTNPSYGSKLIVLDEYDGHSLISPSITPEEYTHRYGGRNKKWYFMYFKRSFVRRFDGIFKSYPHLKQMDVYPMTYGIAEAYIPNHFNSKREIEILCTLRGHKTMPTRQRVQDWIVQYGKERNILNMITGQINTATRTTVSKIYFEQMYNSKIIVTVNPAFWEGDFRLWEALCTGALIFVDPLYVPHQYPLIGDKHVIFFNNHNQTELFMKLDYYRNNPYKAREIAVNGYLFAMKYHRTVNIIDYVLRSAHLKNSTLNNILPLPKYTYTAQYLNNEAKIQEPTMIQCNSPGIYEVQDDIIIDNNNNITNNHNIIKNSSIKRLSCDHLIKEQNSLDNKGTNIKFLVSH